MAFATWPGALNHRPERDGYRFRPHDAQSRVEMAQGPARKRRLWTDSPAYVTGTWPLMLTEYEIFRAWHHVDLEDGAQWFTLPIYTGASFTSCPCRFSTTYKPSLQGLTWSIGFEIEVRQVPFLASDFAPSIMERAWPDEVEAMPVRDGYTMTPHAPIVRSDIGKGSANTKRWFEDGPVTPELTWAMSADEFEFFRAWYHYGLRDGVSWFTMPAWVGGFSGTRRCRFFDAWEAQLSGTEWLVSAKLDIRDVPYLDYGETFILSTLGEDAFNGLTSGLHHFVHTTYPEAVS